MTSKMMSWCHARGRLTHPWYKTEISRMGENRRKPCQVCKKNLVSTGEHCGKPYRICKEVKYMYMYKACGIIGLIALKELKKLSCWSFGMYHKYGTAFEGSVTFRFHWKSLVLKIHFKVIYHLTALWFFSYILTDNCLDFQLLQIDI